MRRLRGLLADTRPLQVPAYRRLFTAQIVTVIGAQLTVVTVPAQIYSMTGSSAYVGLTGVFGLVPLVVLGLTGFDAHERDRLAARIDALGGHVAPRIVWDGSITHLVCAPPSEGRHRKGLDRVLMYRALLSECPDAPHVQHAARIHLVHHVWVDDCERARVLLPESAYDVTRDVDSADARAQRVASLQPRVLDRTHSDAAPPPAPPTPPAPAAPRRRTSLLSWSRSASFDAPSRDQGLWATHTFHIDMHDAARTRRVIHVVRSAGGHVVPSTDEADYAIGPYVPPAPGRARCYATHHWIERCLYDEALVDVHAHPAYRPPTRPLPIPEARDWCITLTGMDRHAPTYHHTCAVIEVLNRCSGFGTLKTPL